MTPQPHFAITVRRAGRADGAVRLALSTARTNRAAQALYESTGWKRDDENVSYEFERG